LAHCSITALLDSLKLVIIDLLSKELEHSFYLQLACSNFLASVDFYFKELERCFYYLLAGYQVPYFLMV